MPSRFCLRVSCSHRSSKSVVSWRVQMLARIALSIPAMWHVVVRGRRSGRTLEVAVVLSITRSDSRDDWCSRKGELNYYVTHGTSGMEGRDVAFGLFKSKHWCWMQANQVQPRSCINPGRKQAQRVPVLPETIATTKTRNDYLRALLHQKNNRRVAFHSNPIKNEKHVLITRSGVSHWSGHNDHTWKGGRR